MIANNSNNNSRISETESRDPETETGSLAIERRLHGIHGTLETGLRKDASQPGGPHKGEPADVSKFCWSAACRTVVTRFLSCQTTVEAVGNSSGRPVSLVGAWNFPSSETQSKQ